MDRPLKIDREIDSRLLDRWWRQACVIGLGWCLLVAAALFGS
jgi:hypothetical protein